MKQFAKRGISLILALVLIVGLLAGLCFSVDAAASVEYVYGTASYSGDTFYNVIYNWGTREETATFLSPNAEAFYTGDYTYDSLSQLSGSTLKNKLTELMTDKHDYINDYDETRALFAFTDCENSGKVSNKISAFYTGSLVGPAWDGGDTWNREHTWPNSKGLNGSDENDIMMLRPELKSANSSRGNTAYGESSGYFFPNEGNYDVRGDVARIILYVHVRWGNNNLYGTNGVIENEEILLKWMEEDPVDTWELGRNDSVESVTGTRNVFIDYPELAFLMLEEAIPTGMSTPSGNAAQSEYTINAVANGHGSVMVSGKTITATPEEGYAVGGYSILSGTATVTQSGKFFIVDASSDCTIQIDFVPRTAATVYIMEDGQQVSTLNAYVGDTVYLPENTQTAPEGYTFIGWVTSAVSETEQMPAKIYKVGEVFEITSENAQIYALYTIAEADESGTVSSFQLHTGEIEEGYYLVVQNGGAMTAAITDKNRLCITEVDINDDTIISTDESLIWYFERDTDGYYTIYNAATGKYAASTGTKNTATLSSSVDSKAQWTVNKNTDNTFDIINRNNQSSNINAYLRRNADFGFATYAKAAPSEPPVLYKGIAAKVSYTTGEAYGDNNEENEDVPAVIIKQPTTQKVKAGSTAEFSVEATGDGLTYQWQYKTSASGSWKDCTDSGSKTAALSVGATTGKSSYYYRCKITDSRGNVTYSNEARLYVLGVTSQPASQKVAAGETVKFTVAATGAGKTYQWQYKTSSSGSWKDCTDSGSKTAALSVSATTDKNGYYYRCKVMDNAGNVTYTNEVRLYVLGVTSQPATQKVKDGQTAKFSIKASGYSVTYQWQYKTSSSGSWKDCTDSGSKTAALSVSATTGKSSYYYRCKIMDNAGNVTYTNEVRLYVLGIKTQPTTQKVAAGETVKFTVKATGAGKTYQWQSSADGETWKNCSSSTAKNATFTFTGKTSHNGNYYRCKIMDNAGNVTYTNEVRLYVLGIKTQPTTQKVAAGKTVKFTVKATGNGLKYQWQSSADGKTWKNCSSSTAKNATFTFTGKTSHNGNYYRCKVTDSAGNVVYSGSARLYVLGIKDQPDNKTVSNGKTAKFAVEATGHDVTYRWQYSTDGGKTWTNCKSSNSKKDTFTFTATNSKNGYYYRCKITDSAGNVVYSSKAKLTVKQ